MTLPNQPGPRPNPVYGTGANPPGSWQPPQPPAKKPFYKKKWFWLVAIIAIIAIAISTSGGGGSDSSTDGVVSDPTQSSQAEGAPAAPAQDEGPDFPGKKDGDISAQSGQTVSTNDLVVTSTPLAGGNLDVGPALCSTITIVNNGDDSETFNPFSFTLQNPEGAVVNPTFYGSNTMLSSGELVPGGRIQGDVCFENQRGTRGLPGTYVVLFEPSFFGGDRVAWVTTF